MGTSHHRASCSGPDRGMHPHYIQLWVGTCHERLRCLNCRSNEGTGGRETDPLGDQTRVISAVPTGDSGLSQLGFISGVASVSRRGPNGPRRPFRRCKQRVPGRVRTARCRRRRRHRRSLPAERNETLETNLLLATGSNDSLVPPSTLTNVSVELTGVLLQPGQQVGSFKDGTARRVVVAEGATHLSESDNPVLVRETTHWALQSIGESPPPDLGITSSCSDSSAFSPQRC